MPVTDYSTTPSANTSIGGVNIAEGCPAANLNNATRILMADVRVMYNGLPVLSDYIKKDASIQMDSVLRHSGRGAYFHWNSSAQTSGRVFAQAEGGSAPTMADGDILVEWAA